ncbi:probable glucuronoxylan glucuronosyltransferase IRX7 [Tanacetum coccineum]
MEVHPKNVSGRFYSKRVRTEILRKYGNDARFYLKRHRYAGYQSEIVRSVFCLCPLGWAPWSPRKGWAKLWQSNLHVWAFDKRSAIQRNLWDPKLRRALLFNDDVATGDATWEVLVALSKKLGRSHRRSRAADE